MVLGNCAGFSEKFSPSYPSNSQVWDISNYAHVRFYKCINDILMQGNRFKRLGDTMVVDSRCAGWNYICKITNSEIICHDGNPSVKLF